MTSSTTRSSRSTAQKKTMPNTENAIPKAKASAGIKKKLRTNKKDNDNEKQQEKTNIELTDIDISEHPEYVRLMSEIDRSRDEKLERVQNWRNLERQAIHDWFAAQKKQAWDDFYFARKKVRSDLVQDIQRKITRLKQELSQLNEQTRVQYVEHELDYEDWIPPERLCSIASFAGGATNEEADRDLAFARQPYNGNNTPNLVYSDYESRSTTDDTGEDPEAVSPSLPSTHNLQSNQLTSNNATNTTSNTSVHEPPPQSQQQSQQQQEQDRLYPPFECEESQRRDWWPYRSTTAA
ncbi:hypothetical protein BD560DRAFT_405491 [Blakeslea trispora]|nr:hypothetical protein BD560DRAFT_405491 [Blakeslea trispora]